MKRGWGGRQDRGKDPSKRKKEKPLLLLSARLAKTMRQPLLESAPCLGYLCGSCPRRSVQTSVWVNLRRALTIPGLQSFGKSFAQGTKDAEKKKKRYKKTSSPSPRKPTIWEGTSLLTGRWACRFRGTALVFQKNRPSPFLWWPLPLETFIYGLMCWNNKHGHQHLGLGEAGRGVSQLCVRRENEAAALADPFRALFVLPECKYQLRPGILVYCVKTGKRSLNYLQINCLLPLSVPRGPIRACAWKSWASASHFLHAPGSLPTHPLPDTRPAKVICGCHFSWQTWML